MQLISPFFKLLLLGFSFLMITSCGSDDPVFTEEQQIEFFLQNTGQSFESLPSGLRYNIVDEGIGEFPKSGDVIDLFVLGFSLDNTVFINNFGAAPFVIDPFNDESLPPGLLEGLMLLKNKGRGEMVMPSEIGYGSTGNASGAVPPNSPVAFRVEIGCLDNPEESLAANNNAIEEYLAANALTAQQTESGLYFIIEKEGDGESPAANSIVDVNYRGYLLDGTEFDSSLGSGAPANFSLENVIPGWQEGIPLLSRGGKGQLFIPHDLGYGCYPPNDIIPPLGVLVFDVELVDF